MSLGYRRPLSAPGSQKNQDTNQCFRACLVWLLDEIIRGQNTVCSPSMSLGLKR